MNEEFNVSDKINEIMGTGFNVESKLTEILGTPKEFDAAAHVADMLK